MDLSFLLCKLKILSSIRVRVKRGNAYCLAPSGGSTIVTSFYPMPSTPKLSHTSGNHCYIEFQSWEEIDLNFHCHDDGRREVKNFLLETVNNC